MLSACTQPGMCFASWIAQSSRNTAAAAVSNMKPAFKSSNNMVIAVHAVTWHVVFVIMSLNSDQSSPTFQVAECIKFIP